MINATTEQALEAVYVAFSDNPTPRRIDGCPCCTSPAQLCALLAQPLRLLDTDTLSRYGKKAMTMP